MTIHRHAKSGPQPYYDRDGITVYHGDALDVLPTIEAVDHVLTDPPYAPRAMRNARSAKITYVRDHKHYEFGYAALSPELREAAACHAGRLARRWVLAWTDIESAHLWRADLEASGLRYVRTGIWVREHGAPQFSGDRPAQGVEACVIAHSEARMAWNGGGRPAVWVGPIVNSQSERLHSSPKPLWLMKHLIEQFTDPGDLILDPFAGSLTTLVAAHQLGRRAIGIELNKDYIDAGIERLRQGVLL